MSADGASDEWWKNAQILHALVQLKISHDGELASAYKEIVCTVSNQSTGGRELGEDDMIDREAMRLVANAVADGQTLDDLIKPMLAKSKKRRADDLESKKPSKRRHSKSKDASG